MWLPTHVGIYVYPCSQKGPDRDTMSAVVRVFNFMIIHYTSIYSVSYMHAWGHGDANASYIYFVSKQFQYGSHFSHHFIDKQYGTHHHYSRGKSLGDIKNVHCCLLSASTERIGNRWYQWPGAPFTPFHHHHCADLLACIQHKQWKILEACVNACWVYFVESVSKM